MLESFFLCIFAIFFVYGIISFIYSIIKFPHENVPYVIKAFNDEDSIESRIRLAMLKHREIIVVDAGSTDTTADIIKKMKEKYSCISLIEAN